MSRTADLAGELQAEDAIHEHERLELRARRHLLAGLHAVQEVPGRGRVVVLVEGVVYQGSAVQLLDLIRRAPPGARTLLIVGHDPALPDLALMLRQLLRLLGRRERCRTA